MIFLLLLVVKINKNRNRQYICLQNTLPFIVFSSSQLCEVGRPNNIVMLKQRRLKGTKFSDLLKNHPSRRLFRCRASVLMIGLRILTPFSYLEIISAATATESDSVSPRTAYITKVEYFLFSFNIPPSHQFYLIFF